MNSPMKIAYIAAGAAGMYCGSCMHDNTLVTALQQQGMDAILIPTYTPLRTDERDVSMERVFYSGVNVFLQQKLGLFRKTPRLVDKLFENKRLLQWVSRFSGATKAQDLGALTVSVMRGSDGFQAKELEKLVTWLAEDFKPDLVHLTNPMFVGFAAAIKKACKVPVLCGLQGEDLFLDDLPEPYKSEAFGVFHQKMRDIDGFLTFTRYYADHVADYLKIPRHKIHQAPLGLRLDDFHCGIWPKPDPFTVGYLARLCPEKGLDLLVDAFIMLAKQLQPNDRLHLKLGGFLPKKDQPFFQKQMARLEKLGLSGQVNYVGELDRNQKIAFFEDVHLCCVPSTYREAKGLYVLESWANGVPVVQPDHGSFPELVAATLGGVLFEPGNAGALAAAIRQFIQDPGLCAKLGQNGHTGVHAHFSSAGMAGKVTQIYRQYLHPE